VKEPKLARKSLVVGKEYLHGPEDMQSRLEPIKLMYVGIDLVVVMQKNGKEKAMDLDFFLEYATENGSSIFGY
jgi:hypothetical protein